MAEEIKSPKPAVHSQVKVENAGDTLGVKFRQNISMLMERIRYAAWAGITFRGARDLYEVLGYKRVLLYTDFLERYKRNGLASRIVNAEPQATWRNPPQIYETRTRKNASVAQNGSEFEKATKALFKRLKMWNTIERADKLSGIGRFGVILIGARGNPESPLTRVNGPEDIFYLQPYGEGNIQTITVEDDPKKERYGLPLAYTLNIPGFTGGFSTFRAHYTRIIHISENLLDGNLFGESRLLDVWNYLDDLEKITGGSAEAYWINSNHGLHADADKDLELLDKDAQNISEEMDEYYHGMRRFVRTKGIKLNSLGVDVADPTGPFNVIVSIISGAKGIPKRILLGSEMGQLASTQDRYNWNERMHERQLVYAEPMILRPLIDFFVSIGALPEPKESPDSYECDWPDLLALNADQKSVIAQRVATAALTISRQAQTGWVITPQEFRGALLGHMLDSELPKGWDSPRITKKPPQQVTKQQGTDGNKSRSGTTDEVPATDPTTGTDSGGN